jgi:hypothetical protein
VPYRAGCLWSATLRSFGDNPSLQLATRCHPSTSNSFTRPCHLPHFDLFPLPNQTPPSMTDMSVNQDTLTLDEANKVRISLGLTPIGAEVAAGEDAPVDTDAIAEANYAERRAEMKRAKEEKDIKERIEK